MTVIKSDLDAPTPAQQVPNAPNASIPKSNAWDAIQYVYSTLTALVALNLQQMSDRIMQTSGEARLAEAAAARAEKLARKAINDDMTILKAQVFN